MTSSSGSTIRHTQDGARTTYLSANDLDGDDASNGSTWAEGPGWWEGVASEHVEEVKEGARVLEELISQGKLRPGELTVRPRAPISLVSVTGSCTRPDEVVVG